MDTYFYTKEGDTPRCDSGHQPLPRARRGERAGSGISGRVVVDLSVSHPVKGQCQSDRTDCTSLVGTELGCFLPALGVIVLIARAL